MVGVPVRGVDGAELGTVQDIYRVAENEVYIVGGGGYGTFDVPAVRAFIRIFAPRRGEIVVDAEALDLRPPKQRDTDGDRPRAPRRTSHRRKRTAIDPATGAPAQPASAEQATAEQAPEVDQAPDANIEPARDPAADSAR